MTATTTDQTAGAIERQRMDVDIACVGFGPAMGGFLTTLSRHLMNEDGTPRLESAVSPGMPLQVICYERADDIGFGVSGIVTRGRAIRARVLLNDHPLINRRGRRECRVLAAPAAPCAKVKSTRVSHHRSAKQSGIPCAMVLRFPSCSPRRPGFVVSVICE